MFGLKRKVPDKAFTHNDNCKILAADPGVQIPWSEIRRGVWEARCVCGVEYHHEPVTDDRVRLDPLDPKTSRHAGECEFAAETDPAVLKFLLKVKPGMDDGYWWVECGACHISWQVLHYAKSRA